LTLLLERALQNDTVKPMNDDPQGSVDHGGNFRRGILRPVAAVGRWLDQVDPGTHRRIKGLRLVTAYGIAAALGTLQDIAHSVPSSVSLGYLAGSFALWASVSEGKTTRAESSRDLVLLSFAAALGAVLFVVFSRPLQIASRAGPELILVTGAFLVGYLKRFGVLGAGLGSQIYIGELLAYGARLTAADLRAIGIAALIAALASIVPRVLSGPAERPISIPALAAGPAPCSGRCSPEFFMGLQAAIGALVIVVLNDLIGLVESSWAITACTYVVAGSATGTIQRVRRRIIGTLIGVPLGLACLPVAVHAPLLIWAAAAFAMVVYAMALPERYDIACAAFAFTLIVTLAARGVHSIPLLAARAWETLLGGSIGLVAAMFVFPLRSSGTGE
jgi:hypothetical protein